MEKWLVSSGLRYPFFSFPVLCLPILFHVSRHTCATLLVHQGVAITTVQKLLGHTSVKTTQIYSEVLSSTIVRDLKNVQRKKVKMFPDKGLRTSDFIDNR
ncbi:tyrosine-type recombinase/integrase [Phocaeicola vulgatus]